MNRSVFRHMSVFACAVLFALSLWGQQSMTNGGVTGRVTDQSGAAVPDATVTLTDRATNTSQTVQTNTDGLYVFNNVPAGAYDLTVAKQGFRKTVISNQTVATGTVLTLNATLQVGTATETVEVTATVGAELQTENATMGSSIVGSAVLNLPTITRDVSQLLFFQPTAAPTFNGVEGNVTSGQIAGSFSDQNTIMLDGGLNTTDFEGDNNYAGLQHGTGAMPMPAESIEEFRVNTNNMSPDFSMSQGGQVLVTTKRGTNSFHGAAYDFFQGDWLNSNDWNNNFLGIPKPKAHFNRFGGALGGPLTGNILGGKTYFYVNYEGQRYPRSGPFEKLVPSATLRAGIIQERDAAGNIIAYNLATSTACGPTGGLPCDPRHIGISPAISSFWSKYEPPCNDFNYGDHGLNTCGFIGNLTFPLTNDFGVIRIDHDFGSNWRLFTTYRYYREPNPDTAQVDIGGLLPGDVLGQPKSASTTIVQPRFFVVGLTGTISPTLTNDFHGSFLRDQWQWLRAGGVPQVPGSPGVWEIGGESQLNALIPLNADTQNSRPRLWDGHDYDYRDTITKLAGTHLFQFGGEFLNQYWHFDRYDLVVGGLTQLVYNISNTTSNPIAMPALYQPPPCTGTVTTNCLPSTLLTGTNGWNNLYAELTGMVQSSAVVATRAGANLALQPFGTPARSFDTERTWNIFFNDTWKVKPNFTLTYGLNYQVQLPPTERNGTQEILTDAQGDILTTQTYLNSRLAATLNGGTYAPTIGFSPINDVKAAQGYPYAPFYGGIGPRVAIAWTPNPSGGWLSKLFGDKATVIRAGYGRFYSRNLGVDLVSSPVLGDGFLQSLSCPNPTRAGACTAPGGADPTTAFRIGVDGNVAPLPAATPTLPIPVTPGFNGVPPAGIGDYLDYDFRPSASNQVDFSIQRQFKGGLLVELGYVGSYANHLYQGIDLNDVPWMLNRGGQTFAQAYDNLYFASAAGVPISKVAPQPFFQASLPAGSSYCSGFANCTQAVYHNEASNISTQSVTSLWSDLDPFFNFGSQLLSTPGQCSTYCYGSTSLGYSNYNALVASVTKRTSSGLTLIGNFTWSKALGIVGLNQEFVFNNVDNPWHLATDYGPQYFDRKYTGNLLASYTLPFAKNSGRLLKLIAGGWTISPILSVGSGLPLEIYTGSFQEFGNGFDGEGCQAVPLSSMSYNNSPVLNVTSNGTVGVNGDPVNGGAGVNLFPNAAAVFANFRPALVGIDNNCGGAGRLRGQSRWNLDLGLTKNFAFTERIGLEFYAQAFNIFNHMEFDDPGGHTGQPALNLQDPADFGVLFNQYNALALGGGGASAEYTRIIQLGVRIHF